MRTKRGKLVCEINQLLVYEKEGKVALPLSKSSRDYLSQYIVLTDKVLLAIGKHAMRYQIPCEICAHYTDMEDFFSDWCALGYSRTEARKLMHEGNGEFMRLPDGLGYVRFAI